MLLVAFVACKPALYQVPSLQYLPVTNPPKPEPPVEVSFDQPVKDFVECVNCHNTGQQQPLFNI